MARPKGLSRPPMLPVKGQEPAPGTIQRGVGKPKPAARPANVSTTRDGSTRPSAPLQKTYVSKGEINQTGNARNGQNYATFTVKGRPGEYHEYIDPKTGKRTVKHVGPSSLLNSLGGS